MALLLVRGVLGAVTVAQAAAFLMNGGPSSAGSWAIALMTVISGALLMVGFLTPGAAAITAMGALVIAFLLPLHTAALFLGGTAGVLVITNAAALVLLGPGAFSLDAHFFGRREIIIPHEQSLKGTRP